ATAGRKPLAKEIQYRHGTDRGIRKDAEPRTHRARQRNSFAMDRVLGQSHRTSGVNDGQPAGRRAKWDSKLGGERRDRVAVNPVRSGPCAVTRRALYVKALSPGAELQFVPFAG